MASVLRLRAALHTDPSGPGSTPQFPWRLGAGRITGEGPRSSGPLRPLAAGRGPHCRPHGQSRPLRPGPAAGGLRGRAGLSGSPDPGIGRPLSRGRAGPGRAWQGRAGLWPHHQTGVSPEGPRRPAGVLRAAGASQDPVAAAAGGPRAGPAGPRPTVVIPKAGRGEAEGTEAPLGSAPGGLRCLRSLGSLRSLRRAPLKRKRPSHGSRHVGARVASAWPFFFGKGRRERPWGKGRLALLVQHCHQAERVGDPLSRRPAASRGRLARG